MITKDCGDRRSIFFGAADAEHRGIQPAAVGLHVWITNPAEELRCIHPILQASDIVVGSHGKLVVGIAGEDRIGVFEMLLKKRQPIRAAHRQGGQFEQIVDHPLVDRDRARPDQLRRLDPQQEKQRANRLVFQKNRFDLRHLADRLLLDKLCPFEHLSHLEDALGKRSVGHWAQRGGGWRRDELSDDSRRALLNLLRERQ